MLQGESRTLLAAETVLRAPGAGAPPANAGSGAHRGSWRLALGVVLVMLVCAGLLSTLGTGSSAVRERPRTGLVHAGLLTLPAAAQRPGVGSIGSRCPCL